jgi:hypothetical protein
MYAIGCASTPYSVPLYLSTSAAKHAGSRTMSDHQFDGHFPEEAEQNEIFGPVLLALMVLTSSVLVIWAMS